MLSICLDYNLFGTIFLELMNTKTALSAVSCLLFTMWLQNVGKFSDMWRDIQLTHFHVPMVFYIYMYWVRNMVTSK